MVEFVRLPEVQRILAILMALVSFCSTFYLSAMWTMKRAITVAPHDGQPGLGALFMGMMIGVPIAVLVYSVSFHFMQNWEKRYTQRLDEKNRLTDV